MAKKKSDELDETTEVVETKPTEVVETPVEAVVSDVKVIPAEEANGLTYAPTVVRGKKTFSF